MVTAMLSVGFVVEGASEQRLVESNLFRSARYFVERLCALEAV